ncbi:MAG: pyridine nucleotide-disulfide oxidoreductase, partial [Petrimonas sp.]|nr:pyridine nucleotide-disulfide oxidoreductase [Petrimonas sp.]
MDLMGSSYLMAHGMGMPVEDAETTVEFPSSGEYYVFVRTFNWTSPWFYGEVPGQFELWVNGKPTGTVLGTKGSSWMWQHAGKIVVREKTATFALHDLTGFNGRVDAIYFTTAENELPLDDIGQLNQFRKDKLGLPETPRNAGTFDFVVVGG